MAEDDNNWTGDVHIPPCLKPFCHEILKDFTDSMKKRGLVVVSTYPRYGRFSSHFKKGVQGCTFTVLHQCELFWNKIFKMREFLSDSEEKFWTVNFNTEKLLPYQNPFTAHDRVVNEFCDFFNDFDTRDLFDETSKADFLEELESYTKKCKNKLASSCDNSAPSASAAARPDILELEGKLSELPDNMVQVQDVATFDCANLSENISAKDPDQCLEGEAGFTQFPDMFGVKDQMKTFVQKEALDFQGHEEFSFSSQDECLKMKDKISEWTNFSEEKLLLNIKYMIFEVLPVMYKKSNWIGLACIAFCDRPVLQERAISFLKLMFLETQDRDKKATFSTLYNAEGILYEAIEKLAIEIVKTGDKSLSKTLHQVSVAYLMLLSEIIMTAKTKSEMNTLGMMIDTIRGRQWPKSKESSKSIYSLIMDLTPEKLALLRQNVTSHVEHTKLPQAGKENMALQFVTVYQSLQELFRRMDINILNVLKHYVTPSGKLLTQVFQKDSVPPACASLLIHGLILFLQHGLNRTTDADVSNMCEKCIEIICTIKDVPHEVKNLQWTLLSDSKSVVRSSMTKELRKSTTKYQKHIQQHLQNEVERLLIPLVVAEKDSLHTDSSLEKTKAANKLPQGEMWATFYGHFHNYPVHVLLNASDEQKNVLQSSDNQQTLLTDFRRNEISVLSQLSHKNVIKMYAYQDSAYPVFYILENCKQRNLQTALRNGFKSGNFYVRAELLNFLRCALTGLEYCHSKDFIHRNLTAASLFITGVGCAKLCGFHLACNLKKGQNAIFDQSNPGIPTRWSAPESLRDDKYSKESDVWMMGHLIYEVMAHGMLPYSRSKLKDWEVVEKIVKQKISLHMLKCIEKQTMKIIEHCTKFSPTSRPSVSEVLAKLMEVPDISTTPSSPFPCETREPWQPSTDYGMGPQRTEALVDEYTENEDRMPMSLSDVITRETVNSNYIFTEKIQGKWSIQMLTLICEKVLKDLLPSFEVQQKEGEMPMLKISIPSQSYGSLEKICRNRKLGDSSLQISLYCAYKVACLLEELHNKDWILGDISAPFLYVEVVGNGKHLDLKVHVVSLGHLQHLGDDQRMMKRPDDEGVLKRAAHEVDTEGYFSPDSDVTCYGHLLDYILHSTAEGKTSQLSEENQGLQQNQAQTFPPKSFESGIQHLRSLIASCKIHRASERPKSQELVTKMRKILRNNFWLSLNDSSDTSGEGRGFTTIASLCSSLLTTK